MRILRQKWLHNGYKMVTKWLNQWPGLKSRCCLLPVILVSLLPLTSLIHPGLPLTHDGRDHVARIANFYQSLSEGNLVPRWAGNLNWGYGHPILMFLYPFPSYLASVFLFAGMPLVAAVKVVFGLSFILSGVFMYLWLKEFLSKEAGFAGGLLYLFAPYRFVDLYVRGAIGECWAFVWPPLIFWFALKLSREFRWRYLAGGSFALAFMILSHNALSLMFLPLIFGYFAYLIFLSNHKVLFAIRYSLFAILGFALSAFFWLPAFAEGKYTLRDIVTRGMITGFEPLARLIRSPWSYAGTGGFSVQIGVLQWLAILAAPVIIYRFRQKKNELWLFALLLLASFFTAVGMILPGARFLYLQISLLQKFQFAWRWLSLAIFPTAAFAAFGVSLSPKKLRLPLVFLIIFFSYALTWHQWRPQDYQHRDASFYTDLFPGTTDTGESAPRWSVRFMESFPLSPVQVIGGEASVTELKRETNFHQYRITNSEKAQFVENTLYFPGWRLFVDGQPAVIEYQDPNHHGVITFSLEPGHHDVILEFGETKLRRLANAISLLSLTFLLLGPFGISLVKKRKQLNLQLNKRLNKQAIQLR